MRAYVSEKLATRCAPAKAEAQTHGEAVDASRTISDRAAHQMGHPSVGANPTGGATGSGGKYFSDSELKSLEASSAARAATQDVEKQWLLLAQIVAENPDCFDPKTVATARQALPPGS